MLPSKNFFTFFVFIVEADFTSSMNALNSQKENADRLIEQLQRDVEARDNEITTMKEAEANQQEEKELLLNEVQQLSEAVELLKEKDVNISRLEEELELLTDEKAKLEQQLASAKEELVQLQNTNEQLQVDVENAKTAAEAMIVGEAEASPDVAIGTSVPEDTLSEEASPIVEGSISLQLDPLLMSSSVDPLSSEELEKVRSEMSDIQAELAKVKTLNEKLKAKLRAHMKKEKAKSESVGEYDSSEMKADIEKARQDKLNLEKSAHELRKELDEVVRRKDGVIGDLKRKIRQLLDEKTRNDNLLEKYEKLVAEKDDEIKTLTENADLQVQELKHSYQLLCEEMENSKDRFEQILDNKEAEVENFKSELSDAMLETEQLKRNLQEAHQSSKELNKLKINFDHIVSGLREDLQQALDEKAAADQIAHEFRVQLKRSESSTEQTNTGLSGVAVGNLEIDRTQLEAKLQAAQGEVAFLRETLETILKEKQGLESSLETLRQKGKEDSEETKVGQAAIDSKDGEGALEKELPSLSLNVQESSNDVMWLQSELKKASELNRKLKAALKKRQTRTGSDSKEDEAFNEIRAELDRARAAKIDSDRQVTELRLELNNFVKEKERIVAALKSKMEQVLQEKERVSNLIEQHEKQLVEKDSHVHDLTEQSHSLSLENEALKKSLEELTAVNSKLQLTVQANVDLESRQEYTQSLIDENAKRISELERELGNNKDSYQKEIEDLKQEHEVLLAKREFEADEAITQLRQSSAELQQNIQAISGEKGDIERELSETKSKLEQVLQESYPVIEEKDRNIQELVALMEAKQRDADESIAQLQENERNLQEQIQVFEVTSAEIKEQLKGVQSELEEQMKEFQRQLDKKDQELREEKESHQNERNDFEKKFQDLLKLSQENTSKLEEDLNQAKSEIENFNAQLQVAEREKQNIEKLQSNFDHIMSGLHEDLQQALDGKAAADEIAHEFQVQLENVRKSFSEKTDTKPILQENKIADMLEAAQIEVSDIRAVLDATVKERDELLDKIKSLELLTEERNKKEPIASSDADVKDVGKENDEKVVQEVILQSSVDNQLSASPTSEAEVELENLKNEMQRMKGLNDKLKAKLRTVMKKKRVKTDSGDEDTSIRDEVQSELEKVRQEKLESEKTCQELRVELDAFVRQKNVIVNELKGKIEQLITDKEKSGSLVDHLQQQIEQKDGELQDLWNDVRGLESDNDQAWNNVEELRRENANLCAEIEDFVSQINESKNECSQLKMEQDRLVQEYAFLLDKKDKTIANLENQLEETTEKYKTEIRATRDQQEGIIFQIQSHADNLERERLSASRETEQLKGQLRELNQEREDIDKLKVNFDHIVSSLREDLQHSLEGKAAADQIAHEFQIQLKRLEKVSGKLETRYSDTAVDTSDMEREEEITLEKFEAMKNEADNLRDVLQSVNREKLDLENRIRMLEDAAQERETSDGTIRKDEKDGEKVVSEVPIRSPENELLLTSPPVQPTPIDGASANEDVEKIKDDLSKAQAELEKVKSVNERLKVRLKTMIRKTREAKPEVGDEGSGEELKAELNKTHQEKLESEKAAQQLRVELDAFVRGKEKIVMELKERIQQLLTEKEEISSHIEEYEKLLLKRDAEIGNLGEQLQSLTEQHDEVNYNLEKNKAENQNLKALVDQLQIEKVKSERELQQAKVALEHLLQGDKPLLDEKDQRITVLEAELSNIKELHTAETDSLKDRYDAVISEQQNHANNLEQALIAASTETEQLKSQLHTLEQGREDISKLRTDFDHIVSGLREDLQSALEGKAAADEIAYEFQMKLTRLDNSSASSQINVTDACVGSEEMESVLLSGKEIEIQELKATLDHLRAEKQELEERITGLDEVVQDREGNCKTYFL